MTNEYSIRNSITNNRVSVLYYSINGGQMIELLLVFLLIGLVILYKFGIRKELDNMHNEKTCDEFNNNKER